MTAKEYLNQLSHLKNNIESRIAQLTELRGLVSVVKGIAYDFDRVQTSPSGGMPASVDRLVDLEMKLEQDVIRYMTLKAEIVEQINSLDNAIYSRVLLKRYLQDKSLFTISEEMGYSYSRIKFLHGYALQAFANKFLKVNTK